MDMLNRIKSIRREYSITQGEFADRLKISQGHLSDIENGRRVLTDRTISDICREFNVNEEWLRTGKGDMFLSMGDDFETLIAQCAGDLSDNMKNMIKALLKMPKEKRAIFDELLDEIVKQNGQER